MDSKEREVLTILFNTNKTIFNAKKSNTHRMHSLQDINTQRYDRLYNISINSLDAPLQILRSEIQNILMFSLEYMEFLSTVKGINLYDCAEIIVNIRDINRFKNKKHFISYAGLAPVYVNNSRYTKITKYGKGRAVANKRADPIDYREDLKTVLTKCTVKMIKVDNEYKKYYERQLKRLKFSNPMYKKNRIHLMALKKTVIKFANKIYSEFRRVNKIELEGEKNENR